MSGRPYRLTQDSQRVLAACTKTPRKLSHIQALLLDMDAVRVQKIVGVLVANGYLVNCTPKNTPGRFARQEGQYALAPPRPKRERKVREPELTTNTFALYDVWR